VTTAARRSARDALDAARPAVARLDATRGPEDLAADLIEIWTAVETALRSLVGGSALSGQAVIREARQRQLINFDQANALAEFQAVRDRLENHSYRPSEGDVTAARGAFLKLDSALIGEPTGEAPTATTAGGAGAPPAAVAPAPMAGLEPLSAGGRGVPAWAALLAILIVIGMIGIGAFYAFAHRGPSALERGKQYYANGQREAAVGEFNKAVREEPKSALPHIYLARMARDVGNFSMA